MAEGNDEMARMQRLLQKAEETAREEKRKRENAEMVNKELAEEVRKRSVSQFLEHIHSVSLRLVVPTKTPELTTGAVTNPVGRICPRDIIPWDTFPEEQKQIWDALAASPFCSAQVFPSKSNLGWLPAKFVIGSEAQLRVFENITLERTVCYLFDEVYKNPVTRKVFGLKGSIAFQSNSTVEQTSSSRRVTGARKMGTADQYCIQTVVNDATVQAILMVEYKPPHKLPNSDLLTCLTKKINPSSELFGDNPTGESMWYSAAITQLYSYMVPHNIRYGYVSTGLALVFLKIEDDCNIVKCHVAVPKSDVQDGGPDAMYRTAAAQVFAFTIQASKAEPPPPSWYDKMGVQIWPDLRHQMSDIPETPPKEEKSTSPAFRVSNASHKNFQRSPINTRARCQAEASTTPTRKGDDDSDGDDEDDNRGNRPSSATNRSGRASKKGNVTTLRISGGNPDKRQKGNQQQRGQETQLRIQDRPFCTQKCLWGLAHGGPMDKDCPNLAQHGPEHIDQLEFIRLIHHQLATDRGKGTQCVPLHLSGSRGALFKVRLTSHGYTLVAKGVQTRHLRHLQQEKRLYDRLLSMQGKYIPTCIGMIELKLPYVYGGGVIKHFLFLGWAGKPLHKCLKQVEKTEILDAVTAAFKELHRLGVLHRDAEPRNLVYDSKTRTLMIVDFERSEFRERQPLSAKTTNTDLKRKRDPQAYGMPRQDPFERELTLAVEHVSRCDW